MTTARAAWEELGDKLEALGLKLRLHYKQSRDSEGTEAVDRLREGVRDAFEAAGHAMRDEAVRADVREVGRLFAEAVAGTLEKVGAEIREATSRKPLTAGTAALAASYWPRGGLRAGRRSGPCPGQRRPAAAG